MECTTTSLPAPDNGYYLFSPLATVSIHRRPSGQEDPKVRECRATRVAKKLLPLLGMKYPVAGVLKSTQIPSGRKGF
jgi:hypothetical protein